MHHLHRIFNLALFLIITLISTNHIINDKSETTVSAEPVYEWPSNWTVVLNDSLNTVLYNGKAIAENLSPVIDPKGNPICTNNTLLPPIFFCLGFLYDADAVHVPISKFLLSVVMYIGGSSWVPGEVVWVANRNRPVLFNATLSVDSVSGNLALKDADGSLVWDSGYGSNSSANPVQAMEIDQYGDLIFYGRNPNLTAVWRSFDHPTDTILPNQVLLQGTILTSNQSSVNVSTGSYSMAVEPGGIVLYTGNANQSASSTAAQDLISGDDQNLQPYWYLAYDGYGDYDSFKNSCVASTISTSFEFKITGNLSINTFDTYAVLNGTLINGNGTKCPPNSPAFQLEVSRTFSILRLDRDGNLRKYEPSTNTNGQLSNWYSRFELLPSGTAEQCKIPNICGPYGVCNLGKCSCPGAYGSADAFVQTDSNNPAAGCTPPRPLTSACDASQHHYLQLAGIDYFLNNFTDPQPNISTATDCSALCSSNCSCQAFFFHSATNGCYLAHNLRSLLTAGSSNLYTAYIKVQNEPASREPLSKGAIAGIAVGCSVAFLALLAAALLIARMAFSKNQIDYDDPDEEEERKFLESLPGLPPKFSLQELREATADFSRRLGGGGFGAVYAGVLRRDGSKVAVKKLDSARQGHKEFRAEVATIGNISHVNLVRLRGFCAEKGQRMLVYEHVQNQSLDKWLFRPSPDKLRVCNIHDDCKGMHSLSWKQRRSIALGTAKALMYLHEECREPIIHLDIKTQNILLDENFEPKVADFGLAKLMIERDVTEVVTAVRGTPGYLAPELIKFSTATRKSDVYSFGVVLLELISGKHGLDRNLIEVDPAKCHLPTWTKLTVLEGKVMDIVDPILHEEGLLDEVQARSFLSLAFLCLREDPNTRPNMSDVVKMLQNEENVPHFVTTQLHQDMSIYEAYVSQPINSFMSEILLRNWSQTTNSQVQMTM